jgi:predicted dehydrogenase
MPVYRSPADLGSAALEVAVAVIATPPRDRIKILDSFPNLRAVLVEKPLGDCFDDAAAFLDECERRSIMVQVNLWRRADRLFRRLAAGQLADLVGDLEVATVLYGNGLLNNGTHMIDFARMLLGEPLGVRAADGPGFEEGPLPGDRNPAFALDLSARQSVDFRPLHFGSWRDNGLDLWGSRGRLEILCEGLVVRASPRQAHRAASGEHEIAVDQFQMLEPTVGEALYEMYDNLAAAVAADDAKQLVSSGRSALASASWVDRVLTQTARP